MSDSLYHVELTVGRWPFRRKQGFAFDMLAWYLLYDEYGWDFEMIGKSDRVELMAKMVYCAAKSSNIHDGKAVRFGLKEVAKWVGDVRTSESDKLRAVFTKSMEVIPKEMAEQAAKADVKKKQRGMT